ncbi:MAG: M24 family metallopeptidase [Candidatus Altiarchaeota archaeon]
MSFCRELRLHIGKVRSEMGKVGAGAYFGSGEVDALYLTGRETGRVLVTQSSAVLWVKDVYLDLYHDLYSSGGYPLEVRVHDKGDVESFLRGMRSKSVCVSSADQKEAMGKASNKPVFVGDLVKVARSVKTRWEIGCIRKSCRIAKAGMRKAREVIGVGVRELDAVAEIEGEIRRRGSEAPPFKGGMLLASGRRSADIHAKASLRRIGDGPVVVDLGAVCRGYFSDMTRTFAAGRVSSDERSVMSFVKGLRDEAIDMIRPGMYASSVHRFVDGRIEAKGYKFHHLSGHGVGLEIHENPSFNPDNRMRLKAGMVFTVEPGVYLPGRFGVRFEDTVILAKGGCVKLT